MKQVLGILGLLLFVFVATALMSDAFLKPFNLENLMKRSALFGIISIGVAFVIITGGIDLSIGSVICLVGCGLPFLLQVDYVARGQVPVESVDAENGQVRLAHPPDGLNSGDQVRLGGGKQDNVGLYRITSLDPTSITLAPRPAVDDDSGRITRVHEAAAGSTSVVVSGHGLEPRDRVTFVIDDGREAATARVLAIDGDMLELSEPPPAALAGVTMLDRRPWTSVPVALTIVLGVSVLIGLFHGLLIAKLKLQPFVVTLCGLLLYRGITRGFTQDQTQGLVDEYPTLKLIATAELARIPMTLGLLLAGGLLVASALGWLWVKRQQGGSQSWTGPLVVGVLGLVTVGWGTATVSRLETLAIEASEEEDVKVDLPIGTIRVRIEGRQGVGDWQPLDETTVEASETIQELTIPSLSVIRSVKSGDWRDLRVVVLERAPLEIGLPAPLVILLVIGLLASVFLNRTIYGRYLLAMGNNEEAARYSGIDTDRMIILAYVICAGLAGIGGVLFVLDINSAQPVDFGNFYELYAIAAAVLGGCSLRGGEGTIFGVVVGAALMRVLKNMITLVDWMPTYIEYAIIGAVILAGVIVDELVKRAAARRRMQRIRGGDGE